MTVTAVRKDPQRLTLTVEAEFDASVERIWQLWADPRQLERWWGPPTYPVDNQLVDEITLFTFPVVVGQGTRLFPDTGPDIALDLVDSRATPKGVTIQVYRPAGRPRYSTATAT